MPHAGVHWIWPVDVLNVAPLGRAGLTDHVRVPAHGVVVADGVTVSVNVSTTDCGSVIAATDTLPVRCVTTIANALLLPLSPVAAVAYGSTDWPSPPFSAMYLRSTSAAFAFAVTAPS